MLKLGSGILTWDPCERISDRYGTVYVMDSEMRNANSLDTTLAGRCGTLVAIVLATRTSRHIGDLFHGVYPSTPRVGERITLGSGRLFFDGQRVGLQPDDDRESWWLGIEALYRAHEQTVELYFEPEEFH